MTQEAIASYATPESLFSASPGDMCEGLPLFPGLSPEPTYLTVREVKPEDSTVIVDISYYTARIGRFAGRINKEGTIQWQAI